MRHRKAATEKFLFPPASDRQRKKTAALFPAPEYEVHVPKSILCRQTRRFAGATANSPQEYTQVQIAPLYCLFPSRFFRTVFVNLNRQYAGENCNFSGTRTQEIRNFEGIRCLRNAANASASVSPYSAASVFHRYRPRRVPPVHFSPLNKTVILDRIACRFFYPKSGR